MTLAQNKTVRVLRLTGADTGDHSVMRRIEERKAKGDLTQYPVVKQLIKHLQLGVSSNTTLEKVELDFPPWLSGCIKRELTWGQHLILLCFDISVVNCCLCDLLQLFSCCSSNGNA